MKVAHIAYHHGSSLYIDNKYVCEPEHRWCNNSTDEFDFKAMIAFLREQGVTHIIDEEAFDDNVNANDEWDPQPHLLEEYEEFLKKEELI